MQYPMLLDVEDIRNDLKSRLWFTYRKGFQPIGGTGPSTDQGWGCMLRCGQMLLAQALITRHLGRAWRWRPGALDHTYLNVLRMFEDRKHRIYSLHQIAQMGVSEGKTVGQWFGPNTVAQVLKKLTIYDDWSSLRLHVAMDNTVVLEDVAQVCTSEPEWRSAPRERPFSETNGSIEEPTTSFTADSRAECGSPAKSPLGKWRPLVLIVPLRLGLTSLNPCYVPALKEFFAMPQCLGIMGGRPNHALYFVGAVGDETLLYLDPHECQPTVDLDGESEVDDASYHCSWTLNMPIKNVDPSLALAFFCANADEFGHLCQLLREKLLKASQPALFEVLDTRPPSWPSFVPYAGEETSKLSEFTVVEPHFDTDEEFEILDS